MISYRVSKGFPIGFQRYGSDALQTKMTRAPAAALAADHHSLRPDESAGRLADSIHGIMPLRPEASNKAVRPLSIRLRGKADDLPLAEAPLNGVLS